MASTASAGVRSSATSASVTKSGTAEFSQCRNNARVDRIATVLLLGVAIVVIAGSSSGAAIQSPALLPDMRLFLPTNLISIGLDGDGNRELRFTHITGDLGPGEFEIDPHYNPKT